MQIRVGPAAVLPCAPFRRGRGKQNSYQPRSAEYLLQSQLAFAAPPNRCWHIQISKCSTECASQGPCSSTRTSTQIVNLSETTLNRYFVLSNFRVWIVSRQTAG